MVVASEEFFPPQCSRISSLRLAARLPSPITSSISPPAPRPEGILALGLGAGKTAAEIRDLYLNCGPHIFPPVADNAFGTRREVRTQQRIYNQRWRSHRYDRFALERALQEFLGEKLLGESKLRHVIPSFDGRFSEVFLFKTRHHDDYKQDWRCKMVEVAMATSAALTISIRALDTRGYRLIDGGVWANNPLMLAIVEAMISYDVPRERIKVLSIGCDDDPYYVTRRMVGGGLWQWRKVIGAAMRAQSLAATNQARLLLGPGNVVRIDPALSGGPIELDDYRRAVNELLPAVSGAVAAHRDSEDDAVNAICAHRCATAEETAIKLRYLLRDTPSDAPQAETVKPGPLRQVLARQADQVRPSLSGLPAARRPTPTLTGPEDDEVKAPLSDKQDAAELALLVQPSPATWGIWVKWEILDRLVTEDAEDGHHAENRIITALGAIKADIIRFGRETRRLRLLCHRGQYNTANLPL